MKNKSKEQLGETPFNHVPTVVIAQYVHQRATQPSADPSAVRQSINRQITTRNKRFLCLKVKIYCVLYRWVLVFKPYAVRALIWTCLLQRLSHKIK